MFTTLSLLESSLSFLKKKVGYLNLRVILTKRKKGKKGQVTHLKSKPMKTN